MITLTACKVLSRKRVFGKDVKTGVSYFTSPVTTVKEQKGECVILCESGKNFILKDVSKSSLKKEFRRIA